MALRQMSAQNKSITIERDSLIDISNQLRGEISKVQIACDLAQSQKAKDCMRAISNDNQLHVGDQNQTIDDINVQDLAKDIWAKAVQPLQSREVRIGIR
jgi:hypothetical protein